MHAFNAQHDATAASPDSAFDNASLLPERMREFDSNATTQISAAVAEMAIGNIDLNVEREATLVLPSVTFLENDSELSPPTPTDNPGVALPTGVADLVTMIRDELQGSMETMQRSLEEAATTALTGEHHSLEDYRWQVNRLASACESLGLSGLQHFLQRIVEATCMLDSAASSEVMHACEVLDRWPVLVLDYLDNLGQLSKSQAVCDYLTSTEFSLPLNKKVADIILAELQSPDWSVVQASTPECATIATPEMVSLYVGDDINQALLDSLLQELPTQCQELSAATQRVIADGDVESIQLAQRLAHTVKGAANTVGIRGIAEVSHYLEDILISVNDHERFSPPLAIIVQDAVDCLEGMSEALLGVGEVPAQAQQVLQSMLDWINTGSAGGHDDDCEHGNDGTISWSQSPDLQTASELTAHIDSIATADAVNYQPPVAHGSASSEPAAHEEVPHAVHDNAPLLRVPMTQVDDLLRLSGESKIVGSQLKEGLRRVETQLQGVRRQNQMLQQLVNELEHLVDIRGISAPLLRTNNSGFDALEMDQYGELHTVSRRLAEVAVDSRQWNAAAQNEVDAIEELLLSQAQHHNESQESILRMRMVPASTIVSRLQRAVRQTSRLLDKQVNLIVAGDATQIDSDSLNQLIDPLMHLLRNAIDHGIESSEERVAAGKSEQGHLYIEFGRDGSQITVRVKDDGRGLNHAAIHAAAIDRGLLQPGAMPTEAQLARLILQSGFSTRSEVTQISGRGIGLDVVHDRVLKLKGTLDVRSSQAQFCEFIIRLPASLLSAHALLIRNGKHTVAVASRGIRQIVDSRAIKLSTMDNRLLAQIGDEVYETHRLETLLGNTVNRRGDERGPRPALLVEVSADRVVAILVQAVVDTVDLVVKPMGKFVPQALGVVGATILGDGSVAPVMDIPELLRDRVTNGDDNRSAMATDQSPPERKHHIPTVLVVDDSLSVRRAMEQLLRDAGYEVRLARDGLEAVSIIQGKRPDIMLVDMEMPRMNGIELATHVRNSAGVNDVPIIMITSRSTDKHRKQAAAAGVSHYMTKPYAEDQLLQQISTLINAA